MSEHSRRCMLLAEIGNEYTREEHITEIDQGTTLTEIIEWTKSRDNHLENELRKGWKYARIYILINDDALSFNDRQHVLTIYAVRNRQGGDHYETIVERFTNLRAARSP